jgi:hypothetical protein
MADGRNADKARGQMSADKKSAAQGEQHCQKGTERRVRHNVTFVAPLEHWGVKQQ